VADRLPWLLPELRVVVLGAGELGSAVARLLFASGIPVAVVERPEPLAVRRRAAFADAVRTGEAWVEEVRGLRVDARDLGACLAAGDCVPILVEGLVSPEAWRPAALVDARMTKRGPGPGRRPDRIGVGLGPGFDAGRDVDAVVETARGPDLGRVVWRGPASPDTGEAAPVAGVVDRVVRAPRAGRFVSERSIGALVERGERLGEIAGAPVRAPVSGLLRGLIADGVGVEAGVKLGDVDPRGAGVDVTRVSDKGRAVAAGALEALLALHRARCGR